MWRNKIAFLAAIGLFLCAGLVLGRLSVRLPGPGPAPDKNPPNWLFDQLKLTSDQRQKMDAIWGKTMKSNHESWQKRNQLIDQQNQAIVQLLSAPERARYEKIKAEYGTQLATLDRQRDQAIHEAEAQSQALLSPDQRKLWDELSKSGALHGPHMGPPHGAGGMRGHWPKTRPSSRPFGDMADPSGRPMISN